MIEVWKDIKGYEGLYQISNCGRVRSLISNKIRKFSVNHKGYFQIMLYKDNVGKNYRVNRLVAEAFIGNPYNKEQVNHIDGDKKNNHVSNLEWVTGMENIKHAIDNGLITVKGRKLKSNRKRKSFLQFSKSGEFIKEWDTMKQIRKKYNFKSEWH